MQQIVYKENDDGIFGNNIFIQVTSKRLERDPNLSTFASTGIQVRLSTIHMNKSIAESSYKG